MTEEAKADPFRETIHLAHGPNVDGHDIQASSAQNDELATERAMRHAEDEARRDATAEDARRDLPPTGEEE